MIDIKIEIEHSDERCFEFSVSLKDDKKLTADEIYNKYIKPQLQVMLED
jgi:hypothetical protein